MIKKLNLIGLLFVTSLVVLFQNCSQSSLPKFLSGNRNPNSGMKVSFGDGVDGVPRKVIGYVDFINFQTGTINGWACAVGESRPITAVIQPATNRYSANAQFILANEPSEAILNSPQYCDDSGSNHRFTANISKYLQGSDYMGITLYFGVFAGNDYGPITNNENMIAISGGTGNFNFIPIQKNPSQIPVYFPGFKNYQKTAATFAADIEAAKTITDVELRLSRLVSLANMNFSASLVENEIVQAMYDTFTLAKNLGRAAAVEQVSTLLGGAANGFSAEFVAELTASGAARAIPSAMAGAALVEVMAGMFLLPAVGFGSTLLGNYLYDINAKTFQNFFDPTCDVSCMVTIGTQSIIGFWGPSFVIPNINFGGVDITVEQPYFTTGIAPVMGGKRPTSTVSIKISHAANNLPPAGPSLKYTWYPTTQLVTTASAAQNTCAAQGRKLPTISDFKNDHDQAVAMGKTVQSIFKVPFELHWLSDDVGCGSAGNACFYRPGQEAAGNEAQMVQSFPNDPNGNGNNGNGAYVMCVKVGAAF